MALIDWIILGLVYLAISILAAPVMGKILGRTDIMSDDERRTVR